GEFSARIGTRDMPAGRLEIDAHYRPSASFHNETRSQPLVLTLYEPEPPPFYAFALPALATVASFGAWRLLRGLAARPRPGAAAPAPRRRRWRAHGGAAARAPDHRFPDRGRGARCAHGRADRAGHGGARRIREPGPERSVRADRRSGAARDRGRRAGLRARVVLGRPPAPRAAARHRGPAAAG